MADKIATREAYGNALAELGDKYDFVVLDADLAAATKTGVFKKKFPNRFFDCGIAEGNMVTVAAGIATTGKTVFASSFAMFAAGRAFEQVRNAIGYPHLNVKIGATHAGISAACGMALSAKIYDKSYRVYTILGDGELEEGQVWEASMFAAHYKLDNLCAFIDFNGLQIDGKITRG